MNAPTLDNGRQRTQKVLPPAAKGMLMSEIERLLPVGQPRLVSLCESCRFMQVDFPTMEDPLACPFCVKGHWAGYIVDAPPEDDPWKDCSDFLANKQLDHACK